MDISPAWCSTPYYIISPSCCPCNDLASSLWMHRNAFQMFKRYSNIESNCFSLSVFCNQQVESGRRTINNPVPYICSLCLDSCVNRKRLPKIFSMLFYILLLFQSIFLLLHLAAVHVRDSLRPPCMVASSRSAEQNYALPRDE